MSSAQNSMIYFKHTQLSIKCQSWTEINAAIIWNKIRTGFNIIKVDLSVSPKCLKKCKQN